MKRLWALCFRGGVPKTRQSPDRQETRQSMANPESSNRGAGNSEEASRFNDGDGDENIILNPRFEDGLNNWSGRGCKIVLHDSMADGKVLPLNGKFFASATERSQNWNGIQQEITGHVQRKLAYEVAAVVRIFGNTSSADVRATLWAQAPNLREQYIGIANLQATDKEWATLQGKFLLNAEFSRLVIYLEGPPPGTDILVNSLVVKHAEKLPPPPPPNTENVLFGVNIIENSNLADGLNGWFPLGPCNLNVGTGSPHLLPSMARDSLGPHEPLNGSYILVTNRTQTWMGPAQMITDKLKLNLTYQVCAWVRVGSAVGPQSINIALGVDSQWVNGGQVEANDDRWHEIGGAFRIEKQPSKVMVYVQGPSSGVDLMVAGLQIFPVDRQARFRHLKKQTDKVRKRDVVLKFSGSDDNDLFGTFVRVKQTKNRFPFGSCISRTNIDNEDFVDFFVKNFNWAVFGNELKWYWTESQQGKFNYTDADDLLDLCKKNGIEARGHCIFWEVQSTVQSWIQSLDKNGLMTAVQNRLTGLLSRYKDQFKHYDVNNEMLHGSFYQDRLGKDIRAYMFKTAHQLDPSPTLFVNDYHVEDGSDTRASPERYIEQILDLQEQGAPVGGIGIQGHIDNPVGPIVCSALDKLAILGLPIWFTELDVSALNEYVRADDLEVTLREAYAHPAVEGIMLWGFWELFMSRDNAYLVDAEGTVNEAGKRYLSLKQEWLSHAHGHIDEQGEFRFRGFHGTYTVDIMTFSKKTSQTFVIDKGESPASKSGVAHGSLWANIITNHDFSEGLSFWHTNCCQGYVITGEPDVFQGVKPNSGKCYAVISNRTQCWQGLEQDITDKVSPHSTYSVMAYVRVSGPILEHANVQATLRLEYLDGKTSYLFVGRSLVSNDSWEKLEGSFSLEIIPKRVVFYLEGPSPGVDLLVDSVLVTSFSLNKCEGTHTMPATSEDECIIRNPRFEDALNHWSGRGCKILLNNSISDANRNIAPLNGKAFASAVERRESWNGIQQDITSRVKRKIKYEVCAEVRIFGAQSADVRLTLWVQTPNIREKYMGIAKEQASDQEWMKLHGKFLLSNVASKVIVFLEGPPPGVDILVDSLVIKEAEKLHLSHPPVYENILFGVNIVENSNLHNGLVGWHPLGSCTLSVGSGSPPLYPPIARDSLGLHGQLSGRYIRVTNRTQTWMGPAQTITDKLKMHITYQVSAWVRIGYRQSGSQNINVALDVDGQWINGGQAEVHDERWHEIMGSFRLEKQPSKVNIHVQGPSAGVDLMIAGLQVFPVNRRARFEHLNKQIDKIRKRDVVLKFSGANVCILVGASIKVTQRHNSFPFGSSLCLTDLENDDLADFFVKNFNWAVFGNELKWYWTESQKGKFNYNDADELIRFCNRHGKQMRGHCIFWEVEDSVQPWVRSLNRNELMEAVQNRLTGLLSRYKGRFRHYDVNNEMLHGSFFKDRLGNDIHSYMFKTAHQLDPSATLFVNDYNVEDGCDGKSSPEMYIQQILDLQEQGVPVGGIGLQGHISNPIGHVICAALDKLAILGLPIWFTELDVSAVNEHVRADDLEVVLREAFAHSAVEGIVLWGFWELLMFRDNAHLIDAEGRINEAGKRYLALMKEWLTQAEGYIDQQGEFRFRGFHGAYTLEISGSKSLSKTFIVEKGDHPLQVQISI